MITMLVTIAPFKQAGLHSKGVRRAAYLLLFYAVCALQPADSAALLAKHLHSTGSFDFLLNACR